MSKVKVRKRTKINQNAFDAMVEIVAAIHDMPTAVLRKSRVQQACHARDHVIYMARIRGMSLPMIAALIGRHHTSVLQSVRRTASSIASDPAAAREFYVVQRLVDQLAPTNAETEQTLLH